MGIRPEETKENAMPEMICPQCKKSFRQGKHNQRFCHLQCKYDFHNAEKLALYHLKKLAQVEEAEDRLEARGERKPLSGILEALKERTEPQVEQQPPLPRRSLG
jgi:hypothetical protein